ncbi:MAG: hypothetical protein IJ115_06290 [Erysipelotrichaceae bacterium]|nr:hypothetical protein [Erysipelotrichaceae bacterium]
MAKFYGKVGFLDESETKPGVWEPAIQERYYAGDILSNYRRNDGNNINDNVVINNKFSIIADKYAHEHTQDIRWIEYLGGKWKVTNVEVMSPRLILTAGGVYNEQDED